MEPSDDAYDFYQENGYWPWEDMTEDEVCGFVPGDQD